MLRQVEVGSSSACLTDTATYEMNKNEAMTPPRVKDIFERAREIMSQRSEKIDRAPPNRNEGAQCIFERARKFVDECRRREIENARSAKNGQNIVQEEEAIKRRSSSTSKETAPVPSTLPAKTCTSNSTKQGLNLKPEKTSQSQIIPPGPPGCV